MISVELFLFFFFFCECCNQAPSIAFLGGSGSLRKSHKKFPKSEHLSPTLVRDFDRGSLLGCKALRGIAFFSTVFHVFGSGV